MSLHVGRRAMWTMTMCVLAGALVAGGVQARVTQLAGMRMGQHAVDILDIYGRPHAIVWGLPGDEFDTGAAGAAGGEGGEMGGEMGGAAGGMAEAGGVPEEMGGEEMGGGMGPGEFPEEGAAAEGEAGVAGAGAATTGDVQRTHYPIWALPLWVTMDPGDLQWLYRCNGALVGFILNSGGFIKEIVVAAERCDFARSAMWQPHEYVKLGDSYKRVIYRYGWPDETLTYYPTISWSGGGTGELSGGSGPGNTVTWNGRVREYSRDSILRYNENNNISFTLHNMKVVRIYIWSG